MRIWFADRNTNQLITHTNNTCNMRTTKEETTASEYFNCKAKGASKHSRFVEKRFIKGHITATGLVCCALHVLLPSYDIVHAHHIASCRHHNPQSVLPCFAALQPPVSMWLYIYCVCYSTIPMASTKWRQSAVAVFPQETRLSVYSTWITDAFLNATSTPSRARE
jgi:hypothetical protein